MSDWYTRPVLFVADIERTRDFYVDKLGFTESWRHVEDGRPLIAQFDRGGCELIFSSQWPDKAGKGLVFVSLGDGLIDGLRAEYEARGVAVKDGWWGYKLMVVDDPDGNQLYFPYPGADGAQGNGASATETGVRELSEG